MKESFLDVSIEQRENGAFDLKQEVGPCDDTDEHWIILHPKHVETIADMAGFVAANEIPRACERLQDRLNLLAALVTAHTKPGDPLRAAVACLLEDGTTNLVAGESNQFDCGTDIEPVSNGCGTVPKLVSNSSRTRSPTTPPDDPPPFDLV